MIYKHTTLLLLCTIAITNAMVFTSKASTRTSSYVSKVHSLPLASQWIISRYVTGAKIMYAENKSAYITINPNLSSFSGSGGCNSLRGSIYVSGKSLRFDSIVSTKMTCSDSESENRFLKTLEQVKEHKIIGAELFLYNQQKQLIMVLESYR